jgi:hypothetical protein
MTRLALAVAVGAALVAVASAGAFRPFDRDITHIPHTEPPPARKI